MFKFKCKNCNGKGKIFFTNGSNEECVTCDGLGTIGLFYQLIDWIAFLYCTIKNHLFLIKYKIKLYFNRYV